MLTPRYIEADSRLDSRMVHRRSPKLNRLLARTFQSDNHAPGSARQALQSLNGSIDPELADDVRLLVSELVTNSLRHTGSTMIELEVWGSDEVVRVDVRDRGAGFDVTGPPRPGKASGWGLFMVDRLADRWGVETNGETRVWFELLRGGAHGRDRPRFGTAS
jgi:anti-sigma regulatory factor (Ser/Thr protein kinase)